MTDSTQDEATSDSKGADKDLGALRKITWIGISAAVVVFIYFVIADRMTPFTSDARVQAFILRMAPEINGQVQRIGVADNAIVKEGELLFEIDPTPFQIAVDNANAALELAGQSIGASTASVSVAQAKVDEARAAEANIKAQSNRILDLVQRGIYAKAREDEAIAAIQEGRAAVESAEADLQRAKEELGPEGQNNPQIQQATASLQKAQFDLSRTVVSAPSNGVVTNLQLASGQTVVAGQSAMTFISVEDVWLLASYRENSMSVIQGGHKAEVVLDTLPGRIFKATVQSSGWGIASGSVDPATGLPKSGQETGWLTDPERFPVQLVFDEGQVLKGARYGSKAVVVIYSEPNFILRAIAWFRIRLISILTYVS
ncbi:MAG: HlyD family secretion protein [Pseudomonadota bacterium]